MRPAVATLCLLGLAACAAADDGDGQSSGGAATGEDADGSGSNATTVEPSASGEASSATGNSQTSGEATSTGDGPGDSEGSSDADSDGTGPGAFECTRVIGFSQTREWFADGGGFEPVVGDDSWELLWQSGGAIDLWVDAGYPGWGNPVVSRCAGDVSPDRVVFTISGGFQDDPAQWAGWIIDAVDTLLAKPEYAGVQRVVLQPVVGGPANGECPFGAQVVRASSNHPVIDAGIAMAAPAIPIAQIGPSPEVPDCSGFSDSTGHLSNAIEPLVGQTLGEAYLAL